MKSVLKIRRSTMVIAIIVSCIFLLIKCTNDSVPKTEVSHRDNFKEFAGSVACMSCHKSIYGTYIHTEHHLTSSPVTEKNILGSFEKGKNEFVFDKLVTIAMEKRDSGFYQVQYTNGQEQKNGRFDIVVGSGRKGQSYLTWKGNRLVQLPITYYSPAEQWSNSPGYPASKVVYNRPITSRCMECHSTYLQKISDPGIALEDFDHNRIIYGVDCEKCHGPAARHVQFQSQNPGIKEAKFIINPAKLTRQRNLDLCALCHGGHLNKTKPSFDFQVGDTLSNYFSLNTIAEEAANIDVHGNQFGLLVASKCFVMSELTCITCHNTHENENGKIALFSQRCMGCHSEGHGKLCKMTASIGAAITQNCIDCHMPKQLSHTVAVYLQGSTTPTAALMRTHFIKVYPEETEKVLPLIKKIKISNKSKVEHSASIKKK